MVTTACAFAQIKITGRIEADLKERAIQAMERMHVVVSLLNWGERSEIIDTMIDDLRRFS